MKTITCLRDLRREISDLMGRDASEDTIEIVIEHIRGDKNRPLFGADWSEYLETLGDLWQIVKNAKQECRP